MTLPASLPPKVPFLQSLAATPRAVRNPIPWFESLTARYGDTLEVRPASGRQLVLTSDPEVIRHVFQGNHRNYTKSPLQTEHLASALGKGLLTSDGEHWLRQRRLIQPGFHRERLAGLTAIMQAEVDAGIKHLVEAMTRSNNGVVEMSHQMMRLTFKVVARCLFSTAIQEADLNRIELGVSAIQQHLVTTARRPWTKPWYRVSGRSRSIRRLGRELDEILFRIIDERSDSGGRAGDLLDMLLEARYEDTGQGMSRQQLRDELLILFVAGHETTANAMTWLLYLLASHPEEAERLAAEADRVMEGRPPRFEDLARLTFTRQVIQEGLRLYPPAWAVDRLSLEEDEIAGLRIPAGRIVLLFLYRAHRHPAYWRAPDRFRPDRFEPERFKSDFGNKAPYFPFGGGPRLCIGNNFAMMEMQLALAGLLRRFTFEPTEGHRPQVQPLITLQPRGGMPLIVRDR